MVCPSSMRRVRATWVHTSGYVSAPAAWLQPRLEAFRQGIKDLAMVARRYLQTGYAGLTGWLQPEWNYLLRVLPDVGPALAELQRELQVLT